MTRSPWRSAARFAVRAAATAVVAAGGLALLAGVVVPRIGGATPYTVLTGSMSPALPVGALAVVRPSDSIGVGDVITYQLRSGEPEVVTHRVVGVGTTAGGERRYTTQGDANPVADRAAVRPVQVRGELWYAVPGLGYVAALFTGQERRAAAVGFAALLAGYAGWQVLQAARERTRRRRPADAAEEGLPLREPEEVAGG